jgi:succinoglycan biosynthesis transport protein ExoP
MISSPTTSRLVTLTAPETFAAERYQGLRLKLEQLRQDRPLQIVAITSPGAGDGKTLTSINLAGALARETDTRILLIDADLRRSAVGAQLGLADGTPGLAELLSGSPLPLAKFTQRPADCGFDLLPAGSTSMPVQKMFRSERLTQVLADARERYDYVLLDTPPLAPVFDAALLARVADGVIVVVAAGKTPRKLLDAALDLLDPKKVVGIVFNGDSSPLSGYSSGYYSPYFPAPSTRA